MFQTVMFKLTFVNTNMFVFIDLNANVFAFVKFYVRKSKYECIHNFVFTFIEKYRL